MLSMLLFPAGQLLAQQRPLPPCAGPSHPGAGAVGASLNQLTWIDDISIVDWVPPDCTEWNAQPVRALLAAAGRFRLAGDSTILAERLARISAMTEMRYWSSTRNRWRYLFEEAHALGGPANDAIREDFSESDLVADAELFYWLQEDNPTNGVVYRMIIHERSANRLVFETINESPMQAKLLFFRRTVADPGEFRQLYLIERESDNVWHYYSLVRMSGTGGGSGASEASYRNRAEAFFRYIAGIEMTREPPAAR